MALRTSLAMVLAVALVALAGCAGPLADDTATPEPTPDVGSASTTDSSERNATDGTSTAPLSATPTAVSSSPTPTDSSTVTRTSDTTTPTRTPTDATTRTRTPIETSTATRTPVPTSADDAGSGIGKSERVAVRNGTLPVNATEVYRRVERLMDTDAPAPRVEVADRGPVNFSDGYLGPVDTALGYSTESGSVSDCGTFYPASGVSDAITVTPGNLSDSAVELVLVHEFVHTLQPNVTGYDQVYELESYDLSHALSEGSAVFVADEYARRYDKRWNGETPLGIRECLYERAPDPTRYLTARYAMGGQYFAQQLDSPAELSTVYRAPPETAEQLVHGLASDDEPVRELNVSVVGNERWMVEDEQRGGELRLRSWLRTGLAAEQVDTAATGWGADRLVEFDRNGTTGVAWVLRMDSAGDADELAEAVADLEATLESRNATELRSSRVGEETVVVFAGSESFVGNATANGTAGDVTVGVP